MHELGLTQEVVAIVERRLPDQRVSRVVLEVGALTAVLPDAMRFCFDLCTAGTLLEGATLDIVEVPAVAVCRDCGVETRRDAPFGLCPCGGMDLDWRSGQELKIRDVEVM